MNPPLLHRIAAGDPSAVRACLDRYGGLVWTLASRMLRNRADAEDAVQEVFIDLWRTAHRFDPALSSEASFIALLARRRLIDRLRRRERGAEALPEAVPARPGACRVEAGDEAARVREAMGRLAEGQRTCLSLSLTEGLSNEEIAARLGMPLGTVKSHCRRGLLRLRALLSGEPAREEESHD